MSIGNHECRPTPTAIASRRPNCGPNRASRASMSSAISNLLEVVKRLGCWLERTLVFGEQRGPPVGRMGARASFCPSISPGGDDGVKAVSICPAAHQLPKGTFKSDLVYGLTVLEFHASSSNLHGTTSLTEPTALRCYSNTCTLRAMCRALVFVTLIGGCPKLCVRSNRTHLAISRSYVSEEIGHCPGDRTHWQDT